MAAAGTDPPGSGGPATPVGSEAPREPLPAGDLAGGAPDAALPGPDERPPLPAAILLAGAGLSLFQLWQSVFGAIDATLLRPIHLTWVLALAFAVDAGRGGFRGRAAGRDLLLAAASLAAGSAVIGFDRGGVSHILHGLAPFDFAAGGALLLLLLEAVRRRVGIVLTGLVLLFLAYNAFGDSLPGLLAHRGFEFERIVRFEVFTGAGLFGLPLGVASSTVFVFVLFGALLEATGGGRFFISLAFAAAGRSRGGPAKAAVLASAALGSVSGSAIANTVTTGALTIPMMKRLGYRPEEAGGIEAAASTGGQLMPPIMGAGAFLMAELTNTPYSRIVLASVFPALIFFAATLFFVHGLAVRRGIEALPRRARLFPTLAAGAHFLAVVAVVATLLLLDYSPPLVGAAGCLAVVAAASARRRTRTGPKRLLEGLARGAVTAVPVSLACAAAGVVVGVIGQTGVGLQFAEVLLGAAQGSLLPALGLSAVAALILGMGLPVTAAYIVVAVVAAPALVGLGLPVLTAHLILFWLSQTSNVTPPVALAAFAGAGVAGARPMRTAAQAFRLSLGLFLAPLLMAYTPLLPGAGEALGGAQLWAFGSALLSMAALAVALFGHGIRPAGRALRFALGLGAALSFHPSPTVRLLGAVVAGLALLPQLRGREAGTPPRAGVRASGPARGTGAK